MDLDGLATLVESKHQENLRQFKHIRDDIGGIETVQRKTEGRLDLHDIQLTRIKTVGGIIGALWGAIISLATIFWR
jgi:uncharacterized membrane protein